MRSHSGFWRKCRVGFRWFRIATLLAVLALVWIADSGAYFVGRAWGRRKLAPTISPGKTWEGAFGGTAAALVYAIICATFFEGLTGVSWLAAALLLAEKFPTLAIDEAAIETGLRTVEWPARMQRLVSGPLPEILGDDAELWLDGGHNPAAGDMLADTLAMLDERSPKPVYLIVGMMGQKDALGFLAPFRGLVRAIYTVPIPGAHEAPHTQEDLAEIARGAGMQAIDRENVIDALETIAQLPQGAKRVLICGSLYLAGHVLTLQQQLA